MNIELLRSLEEAERLAGEDKLRGFYNLAEEAYHQAPGMNQSSLKHIVPSERNRQRSPAHFREMMIADPEKDTAAKVFGSAFHAAILEPELFDERFCVRPSGAIKTTKAGLAKYIQFSKENLGMPDGLIKVTKVTKMVKEKEVEDFVFEWEENEQLFKKAQARVTAWEAEPKPLSAKSVMSAEAKSRCMTMAQSALSDPRIQKLMEGADREISAWAELHGVLCRGRFDLVRISDAVILDFKTTDDASDLGFDNSILKYDYDFQAALYCKLFELITGRVPVFLIAAVEKQPPFAMNIINMQPGWLHIASCRYREALHTFSDCMESDIWPGYSQKIINSEAPDWLLKKEGLL